jgi:hypothetical protein
MTLNAAELVPHAANVLTHPKLAVEGQLVDRYEGSTSLILSYLVEATEAERLVRTVRGYNIYVAVGQFAYDKIGGIDEANDKRRGYRASAHIEVTKRAALKFLTDAYPESLREKTYVRVAVSNHCLFIGSAS